jgi:hypothetical protein
VKLCPKCKEGAPLIADNGVIEQEVVVSRQTGQAMLTPARVPARMTCTRCDLLLDGWLENAVYDPAKNEFTGGHFVTAMTPDWA